MENSSAPDQPAIWRHHAEIIQDTFSHILNLNIIYTGYFIPRLYLILAKRSGQCFGSEAALGLHSISPRIWISIRNADPDEKSKLGQRKRAN
jgi:hypothetical protein